jgi:acetolactate synthase-1/2/3 large subunit
MIKVTDYIAQRLSEEGVRTVFGMSGGAAVHLFDSFRSHPNIDVVATTHEQAAAMAADGYARVSGRIGVAISTSGPGATNLLTGVCCSYYDSIPTLLITGQVARHRLRGDLGVRQLGFQETDVVSIFKSVTKFARQVDNAEELPDLLDYAIATACEGRQGPVLIDLPDDVQRQVIATRSRKSQDLISDGVGRTEDELNDAIDTMFDKLNSARRPVLIIGGGVKTPDCRARARTLIEKLQIPVVLTWGAIDLLPTSHPLNQGPFGVYGPRSGNLAVQDCDFMLALGTRLSQNLTGGVLESFARDAFKCVVDVDKAELSKFGTRGLHVDLPIWSSLTNFLEQVESRLNSSKQSTISEQRKSWMKQLSGWRSRFRSEESVKGTIGAGTVNANEFVLKLSEHLSERTELFVDTGGNLTWTCNSIVVKNGQKIHSAWNFTPMGYAVPGALGGAFASEQAEIVVAIGDGGMLLCLGELATIARYRLPIKMFVFNNQGHGIQKQTLETWLDGKYVAVDSDSGLGLVSSWSAVAESFGVDFERIDTLTDIDGEIAKVMKSSNATLVEVMISPEMRLYPYLKFGRPLEEQFPESMIMDYIDELNVERYVASSSNLTRKQGQEGW